MEDLPRRKYTHIKRHEINVPPLFKEEFEIALGSIKIDKAPGPDKIPPEAVKIVGETHKDQLLEICNNLLRKQEFPRLWKEAKVVLLNKGKGSEKASDFRQICLINVFGKLLEMLIKNRLEKTIEEGNWF